MARPPPPPPPPSTDARRAPYNQFNHITPLLSPRRQELFKPCRRLKFRHLSGAGISFKKRVRLFSKSMRAKPLIPRRGKLPYGTARSMHSIQYAPSTFHLPSPFSSDFNRTNGISIFLRWAFNDIGERTADMISFNPERRASGTMNQRFRQKSSKRLFHLEY